jgi:hypothetical protein
MPKKKVDIHWLNEPEVKLYSPEGGDNRDSGAERFGTPDFIHVAGKNPRKANKIRGCFCFRCCSA